jgi:hypothetical protein
VSICAPIRAIARRLELHADPAHDRHHKMDNGKLVRRLPAVARHARVDEPAPATRAHRGDPCRSPDSARSLDVLMTIDDPNQKVGVDEIHAPRGDLIYTRAVHRACTSDAQLNEYYDAKQPGPPPAGDRQSVLAMPSSIRDILVPGAYHDAKVSSYRSTADRIADPRVTAVVKLDTGVILDLHFYFLDLTDHPCWQYFRRRSSTQPLARRRRSSRPTTSAGCDRSSRPAGSRSGT